MDAQITVGQLISILLALAGIGALAMVIKVLVNISSTVANLNRILQQNENNLNEILNSLPGIVSNTEQITKSVNEEMGQVSGIIKAVEATIEQTAATVHIVTEDLVIPATDAISKLPLLKKPFTKKKKKFLPNKK